MFALQRTALPPTTRVYPGEQNKTLSKGLYGLDGRAARSAGSVRLWVDSCGTPTSSAARCVTVNLNELGTLFVHRSRKKVNEGPD